MTLHIIETDASNIRPVQLLKTSNLKGSNEYGINGGWYTSTKPDDNNCNILNIAVSGGRPSTLAVIWAIWRPLIMRIFLVLREIREPGLRAA